VFKGVCTVIDRISYLDRLVGIDIFSIPYYGMVLKAIVDWNGIEWRAAEHYWPERPGKWCYELERAGMNENGW